MLVFTTGHQIIISPLLLSVVRISRVAIVFSVWCFPAQCDEKVIWAFATHSLYILDSLDNSVRSYPAIFIARKIILSLMTRCVGRWRGPRAEDTPWPHEKAPNTSHDRFTCQSRKRPSSRSSSMNQSFILIRLGLSSS